MTLAERLAFIAGRLAAVAHPDITRVEVLNGRTIHMPQADGSDNYLKAAHVTTAGGRVPERPTWPDGTA